jgi:hypothetical protein
VQKVQQISAKSEIKVFLKKTLFLVHLSSFQAQQLGTACALGAVNFCNDRVRHNEQLMQ